MSDATLRRIGGNVKVTDLDLISMLTYSSEGRSIVLESPFPTGVQRTVVPRTAGSRTGTLEATFLDTIDGATAASRANAAAASLELGVTHWIANVAIGVDVPLFTNGLTFVATRVTVQQHADDVDAWVLTVEWKQTT